MKSGPRNVATFGPFSRPLEPIPAPLGVSAGAAERWRLLAGEYAIRDGGGLAILQLHIDAFETARHAAAILSTEGMTTTDRFGQARAHPAATILRDARAQMLSTLRALNLDVEAKHPQVGRPLGGR
jgi:phage terminase small subunit